MKLAGTAARRVLVIDDSEISRDVIRDLLEGAGCIVRTLESPLGATAEVVRFDAEFVVVDVNMPVMSGGRFVELIRRNTRLSHVKLVLVSGDSETELRRLGESLEADAVIPKKALNDRLIATLNTLAGGGGDRAQSHVAPKPHAFLLDLDSASTQEIKARLERAGYVVSHRRTGRGILVAVLLEKPSLIVVSQTLTDMSGKMIVDLLKENRETDRLPIILLGDGPEPALASEALKWRASGFLPRAVGEAEFRERLERITNANK